MATDVHVAVYNPSTIFSMPTEITGMVFGTFDHIHEGHIFFLSEAKRHCTKLVVVVAQDTVIHALKGHYPHQILTDRIKAIKSLHVAQTVIAGDTVLEQWSAIQQYGPQLIMVGYDQESLRNALEQVLHIHQQENPGGIPLFKIIIIESHEPERFKSSRLNPL